MRKSIAAGVVAASVLTGGAVGLTLFGPSAVGAKTGATPTTAAPKPSDNADSTKAGRPDGDHRGFGHHGWKMGDASVAAKAIGISEADLTKDLRAGKTIAQVAKAHGVATQKVIDALVAEAKTKVAAAVKAGWITQADANKIQTELNQRVTDLVNGKFPKGRDGGPAFGGPGGPWAGGPGGLGLGGRHLGGPGGAGFTRPTAAAAKAIGISEADLVKDLRAGKTVAQIAKAHGVTSQKVIDALVADGKTKLAAAVKAGRINQDQADKIQAGLKQQVTDLVNGTFQHGPNGDHGGPRFARPGA